VQYQLIASAAAALRAGALGLGRVAGTAAWCPRLAFAPLRVRRGVLVLMTTAGVVAAALAGPAAAQEPQRERLLVTDPYIELHTGPADSFPITFVAERHTWIEIELRHTDWYKVRTPEGKEGWVERHQLESTLTEAGGKKTFRDVLLDDMSTSNMLVSGEVNVQQDSTPTTSLKMQHDLNDAMKGELPPAWSDALKEYYKKLGSE